MCVICNTEFEAKDTKRGREKKTCSVKCSNLLGARNSRTKKSCLECDTEVETSKSNMFPRCEPCKKKGVYKKVCFTCKSQFTSKKSDTLNCSQECVSEFNRRNLLTKNCHECNEEFSRPSTTFALGKRYFCSRKCANRTASRENPSRYGGTWPRRGKEIKMRDGMKCILCSSKKDLECHHFIKILDFEDPNDGHYDENVGTFCRKCHDNLEDEDIGSLSDFYSNIDKYKAKIAA